MRDIEYLEDIREENGIIEISKIVFPLVVVLTQDCDLAQGKYLLSVLVAPLYNVEHVYTGTHLSEIDVLQTDEMQKMKIEKMKIDRKSTAGKYLRKNENKRYHYLNFPQNIPIVDSVIDFKHYFSVDVKILNAVHGNKFVCRVSELYREAISQRFSAFLSRIGLPAEQVTEEA